jgi:hypothetical protein
VCDITLKVLWVCWVLLGACAILNLFYDLFWLEFIRDLLAIRNSVVGYFDIIAVCSIVFSEEKLKVDLKS